jgi:beta-galactosidase GanA
MAYFYSLTRADSHAKLEPEMNYLIRLLFLLLPATIFSQSSIPHLRKHGTTTQLVVQGKPFLVLGGELGNSSSSSLQYMDAIWPKLKAMHLNTVLAPVYWELVEPEEGKFNFTLVDSLIKDARHYDLKLVLLWFGAWKNSMSTYVPAWVKLDQKRFPRAQQQNGASVEILSAFSAANREADVHAFRALMKHLRAVDKKYSTVIMVQVENEIGMLTEAREYGPEANALFKGGVPAELIAYLQKNKEVLVPELKERWATSSYATKGSWETVFGKGLETDEIFQAWYYAQYTGAVAKAGKSEYPLPMFVNAALNYHKVKPGQYPSAGPLPQVMDIWQAGAPAIDMLSPDFYNPYFRHYNDLYTRRGNTLFIPEIRFEPSNAAKVFYVVGHYEALGFSPFSIESTEKPGQEPLARSYALLEQLAPLIHKYSGTGTIEGVLLDTATKREELRMGNYLVSVAHDYTLGWSPEAKKPEWPESGGIIIQTGKDEWIVAGTGMVITFTSDDKAAPLVSILQADEGEYVEGRWVPGRRMNGDQTHQGRHIRIPVGEWGIQQVKLYRYK